LQEKENQQQMIVTSGMKCLESLEKQNQDGLLEKMLKALLISTKAWYSDRCLMTWKTKVSKANVLLFQLQASVHGIKGNESGLLPTPTASCHMGVVAPPETVQQNSQGWSVTRVGTGTKFGAKLTDVINKLEKEMYPTPRASAAMVENMETIAKKNKYNSKLEEKIAMEMYPTPMARDHKDINFNTTWKLGNKSQNTMARQVLKHNKPGGKLNPNFVEFLMGFPMNWTKIDPTE
jgi:hypothetical protein